MNPSPVHRRFTALPLAILAIVSTLHCRGDGSTRPGPSNTGPTVTEVVFTTQPPVTVEGNVAISPAVQVTIRDSSGGLVPTGVVTMSVGMAPWPAPASRISGTLTVTAVNGVATFSDLRVDKPGVGYTLVATSGAVSRSSTPFKVGLTFTGLAAGGLHTCGLTTGGTYCWGLNLYGQLGGATGSSPADSIPVLVTTPVQFVQVAGGEGHTCARSASGVAYCWGYNHQGELGDGTIVGPDQCPGAGFVLRECRLTPNPVAGSGGQLMFATVSSGPLALHTCGLVTGGTVYCWGYNFSGQLGNGTSMNFRTAPVRVLGSGTPPLTFSDVSAGGVQTCGVTTDLAAYCWGFRTSITPALVAGSGTAPLTFTSVSARRFHACGLTTDGAVYCWGSNNLGTLGDGTTNGSDLPVHVLGSGTPPLVFTALSAGDLHTCGVAGGGAVYCWGLNAHGQLGDGTTTNQSMPVQVVESGAGPLVFASVTGGAEHTCGLTTGGLVYCWGYGSDGALGNGAMTHRLTPVPIVQ